MRPRHPSARYRPRSTSPNPRLTPTPMTSKVLAWCVESREKSCPDFLACRPSNANSRSAGTTSHQLNPHRQRGVLYQWTGACSRHVRRHRLSPFPELAHRTFSKMHTRSSLPHLPPSALSKKRPKSVLVRWYRKLQQNPRQMNPMRMRFNLIRTPTQ